MVGKSLWLDGVINQLSYVTAARIAPGKKKARFLGMNGVGSCGLLGIDLDYHGGFSMGIYGALMLKQVTSMLEK